MIIPMTDEEIAIYHKVQKVLHILSKKRIDQQITYILKSQFLTTIDDFFNLHLEDIYDEVVCDGEHPSLKKLKAEWNYLNDEEQLTLYLNTCVMITFMSIYKIILIPFIMITYIKKS